MSCQAHWSRGSILPIACSYVRSASRVVAEFVQREPDEDVAPPAADGAGARGVERVLVPAGLVEIPHALAGDPAVARRDVGRASRASR